VNEPARDVLIQIPESGRTFAIYYFAAASQEEMAEYRRMTNTPRGSTNDLKEIEERIVDDNDL
jgi:glutamine phosphoribosylpyrophosphate amidotransferase